MNEHNGGMASCSVQMDGTVTICREDGSEIKIQPGSVEFSVPEEVPSPSNPFLGTVAIFEKSVGWFSGKSPTPDESPDSPEGEDETP